MTLNELQRAAAVLFAAREVGARGGLDQMKAVCHVLRNRVQAGWAESWLGVLELARETAANEGGAETMLDINSRSLGELARSIDDIFYGSAGDDIARICGRADKEHGPLLYWVFVDRPVTGWFKENIAGKPKEHFQRGIVGFMYLYE